MRRVLPLLGVLVRMAAVAASACGRSSAGSGEAVFSSAPGSSSPSVPAAAAPSVAAVPGTLAPTAAFPAMAGATALGSPCSAGKDSIACAPDGVTAVTCASGVWRTLELCRGPGRCHGVGSALTCDTGLPQPGDACVASSAESQCRSAHEVMTCRGARWMVSPCDPGKLCFRANGKGQAGCK